MAMGRGSGMRRPVLFLTLAFGFVGVSGAAGTIGMFGRPALGQPINGIQRVAEEPTNRESIESAFNPHGHLVFRATSAISCRDCHAAGRSASGAWPVLDNERVRTLVAKGKGAHVGRFADCFRCHPGGRLPSEQP